MNDTERMFASLAENPHFMHILNQDQSVNDPCKVGILQKSFKFGIENPDGPIQVQHFNELIVDIGTAINLSIEECLKDGAFLLGIHLDVVQPAGSDEKPHVALIDTRKDRIP